MTVPGRGYAQTPLGQVHWTEIDPGDATAPVVLALPQTLRSLDEYAGLQAALAARGIRAIAMDTPGRRGSAAPAEHTIVSYAATVSAFLDALNLDEVALVGHRGGGVLAVEVAARRPPAVTRLVLASTPYTGPEFRERRRTAPVDPPPAARADGSHLTDLWAEWAPSYPPDRPDLLDGLVRDVLTAGDRLCDVQRAVSAYRMEERLDRIAVPVLVLAAGSDPVTGAHAQRIGDELTGHGSARVERATVAGAMLPMMETHAEAVADLVAAFVRAPVSGIVGE